MYYDFMDKFKVRPETFDDLFDLMSYTKTKNLIDSFYEAIRKIEGELKNGR